jgi:hypothetical protein
VRLGGNPHDNNEISVKEDSIPWAFGRGSLSVPSLFRDSGMSPEQLGAVSMAETAPCANKPFAMKQRSSDHACYCHGVMDPLANQHVYVIVSYAIIIPASSFAYRSISCSHTSCSQHAHRLSPTTCPTAMDMDCATFSAREMVACMRLWLRTTADGAGTV